MVLFWGKILGNVMEKNLILLVLKEFESKKLEIGIIFINIYRFRWRVKVCY